MTRVESMVSKSSGKAVPNQFVIYTDEGRYFQSYDSVIAFKENGTGKIILDEVYYNWSKTTVKYRNIFLGMTSKEVERDIKTGYFAFADLNKRGIK